MFKCNFACVCMDPNNNIVTYKILSSNHLQLEKFTHTQALEIKNNPQLNKIN